MDRLCTCGNKISSKDTHPACSTCLGVKHAQAALDNTGSCEHCVRFTSKTLRRRLARQASLTGNNPLLSMANLAQTTAQQTAMSQEQQPTMAAQSRSAQVDAYDLLSQDLEEVESEDGDDYEGNSDLLVSDNEDDFDDSPFLPSAQALNPASTLASEKEAPPSPLISLDLQDVCKRAADKLAIPWPTVTAETAKSRYEGKRLPMAKRSARQLPTTTDFPGTVGGALSHMEGQALHVQDADTRWFCVGPRVRQKGEGEKLGLTGLAGRKRDFAY